MTAKFGSYGNTSGTIRIITIFSFTVKKLNISNDQSYINIVLFIYINIHAVMFI